MNRSTGCARIAVTALLITMFATPAFADDRFDFGASIRKAVTSQPPAPQSAPANNPYRGAAIGLMVGGVAVAVYGFTHVTGLEANSNVSNNLDSVGVTVKETKATGIGVAGVAVAALGGVVYAVGERKANRVQPQISFGQDRAVLGGKVRW